MKLPLGEPSYGHDILIMRNTYMMSHPFLVQRMPILSDVFVFIYPVYLVVLYLFGVFHPHRGYKESALFCLFSVIGATIINIVIQLFVDKTRPDIVLELLSENRDALVLDAYLPSSTFPSDHATVSVAIAVATLIMGVKYKKSFLVRRGGILLLFATIMSVGRIMVGIHWPTDILAGILIGIGFPLFLSKARIYSRINKMVFTPLIHLQMWIGKKVFGTKC